MNEVLHANIFFIITSIAVVLFTILVCVLLYQVIKIAKAIRRIVERIESGSETIAEDMSELRSYVKDGNLISQIISFFVGNHSFFTKRRSRRKDS